jgi:hypothetical protein
MLEKVVSPLAQENIGLSSPEEKGNAPLKDNKEPSKVVSLADRKKEK